FQGRHPLLLPAGVPRQAGRGPGDDEPDLVRRHADGAVGDRLRRAVRPGPLPDEGLGDGRDARRIRQMARLAGAGPGERSGGGRPGAAGKSIFRTEGADDAMSTVAVARELPPGVHPAPTSFWRKYIFSLDHKIIGKQYMFYALF